MVLVFAFTACRDEFMDTKPLGEVSESDVWGDPGLAEAFVTEIYNGFGNGGLDEQMLASLSDEAVFTHPGRGINTITESRTNPANPGWVNYTINWSNMYSRIRAANLAVKNLEEPQFEDQVLAERLKGEALFLRAYFYQQLLRYYGGFPIVDRPYELGEEDYTIARNTFEECVNFIVSDTEEAARLLEGKTLVEGRSSQAAALALKARVLLYAASDLRDIPTASAKSGVISGFSNPELIGYTSGSQSERWEKAKKAAKAVLDLGGGYELGLSGPVDPELGTQNYINLSLSRNGGENDLILGRWFIDDKNEGGAWVGRANGPSGYHNWAGNTPLQNLVDDYEMMDGTEFSWDDPEMAEAPYENRDPRFYATILYDGADWKPRTSDVASRDPFNQIQTGQYDLGGGEKHNGLDTRLPGTVEDWNGTHTGYYMRKFIDPDPSIVDQNTRQQIPWPFFRYTEAVLNYVEACIELEQDAEAITWLNKIRYRAGMPGIEGAADLMEKYRNERRIELVYEEHRYHDARRWMIAPETIGAKARIVTVTGNLKAGEEVDIYRYDTDLYDYTYTVSDIAPGVENREWLDKMYFLPIHRDEINRNDKLVQNPGYN